MPKFVQPHDGGPIDSPLLDTWIELLAWLAPADRLEDLSGRAERAYRRALELARDDPPPNDAPGGAPPP